PICQSACQDVHTAQVPPNTAGLAQLLELRDGFPILALCLVNERSQKGPVRSTLHFLESPVIVSRHPVKVSNISERARRKWIDLDGPSRFPASLFGTADLGEKLPVVRVGRVHVEFEAALKFPLGAGSIPFSPPQAVCQLDVRFSEAGVQFYCSP